MMIFVKYLLILKIVKEYLYMFEKRFQNIYVCSSEMTTKMNPMKSAFMLYLIAGICDFSGTPVRGHLARILKYNSIHWFRG
jgi:hypothetical protein